MGKSSTKSLNVTQRRLRNNGHKPIEIFGVLIPRNVKHAYDLDKENDNSFWKDAMEKEINSLLKMNVFQFHPSNYLVKGGRMTICTSTYDFTVKHDLRRKARLVNGGHVTDASMYDSYAATIHTENIRLLLHIVASNNLNILTGDITTAYINAYTEEKIYSSAGPEFGAKEGYRVIVKKALYGLKTSAHNWFHHFATTLREMDFKQSKLDGAIWYCHREDKSGYDYIGHHVDDFIIIADDPDPYMKYIKTKYEVSGDDIPEFYLGINCDVTRIEIIGLFC